MFKIVSVLTDRKVCFKISGEFRKDSRDSRDSKNIVEKSMERNDEFYMKEAIKQAKKAAKNGDVPIGCVIVSNGEIVSRSYNKRNLKSSVLAHAETMAIEKAAKKQGDFRLDGYELYVTLEPCQMCSGAIVQSRIKRVVIGAMNPKAGCGGSIYNMLEEPRFNHVCEVKRGCLEEECSALLKEFFKSLREAKKKTEK